LLRSWFFRIFSLLLILFLLFSNLKLYDDLNFSWSIRSLPANVPYLNLLYINFVQAVIAVFLASDFLKRDRKLDTSEVFYVHPLSNAEYVVGKIWGNLKLFFVLDLLLIVMSVLISVAFSSDKIDWIAYFQYFFLIVFPSLIYIIGLAIFLMLTIKNQAITFVILLAYIGLSAFYLKSKFYFLFDYMAYALPMVKSSITGFSGLETILTQRGIYLSAGLGFIFMTITLFGRLPNTPKSHRLWLTLAVCAWMLSAALAGKYLHSVLNEGKVRRLYTEVNNRYVDASKMFVEDYDITVEQAPHSFSAEVSMKGKAAAADSVFVFCLNPGLQIKSIEDEKGKPLAFERDRQIISVNMGRTVPLGDPLSLTARYAGKIDNQFCYLDIPEEILHTYKSEFMITGGKEYSFQTSDYLLLTPETYWYPRPGTAYSDKNSAWQQTYFSHFRLDVKPLPGLIAVSQGKMTEDSDSTSWRFRPEFPLQSITLSIGKYKKQSVKFQKFEFCIWHFEGHDFYTSAFDSIQEDISTLAIDQLENLERTYKLDYQFKRFYIVEVPALFYAYPHTWSQAQEYVQPEMALFVEKAWSYPDMNPQRYDMNQNNFERNRRMSEIDVQTNRFNQLTAFFTRSELWNWDRRGMQNTPNPYFLFPELYNFRFNIYSTRWPAANRIMELYLQTRSSDPFRAGNFRGVNNYEKANLLFEKFSFRDLLSEVEHRNIMDNITLQQASLLFSNAEMNIGTSVFRDSIFEILKRNEFCNIRFEQLMDTLSKISDSDIYAETEIWNEPTSLPFFDVNTPKITVVTYKGEETIILTMTIYNKSTKDGMVHLNIQTGGGMGGGGRRNRFQSVVDPKNDRKILIKGGECKQIVTFLEDMPRMVSVNTLVSRNLPSEFLFTADHVEREQRPVYEQEGEFLVSLEITENPLEVIVDNEDSLLFHVSGKTAEGLLPKLIQQEEKTQFKYKNIPWYKLTSWIPTINSGLYGKNIHSAMVINGGKGEQVATWKIPVPSPGNYEVYYYLTSLPPRDRNRGRRGRGRNERHQAEYSFIFDYGKTHEPAYLSFENETGWKKFRDNYYFDSDTVRITLTNKGKNEDFIIADAVKIVKSSEQAEME
jgi:ABC-type transport system involved in multi-copper enzyme maturation permease subunit